MSVKRDSTMNLSDMTDNRALWELYDRWLDEARRCHAAGLDIAAGQYQSRAAEIAAILDRPVVVTDEDVERALDAYKAAGDKFNSLGERPNMYYMRAALESIASR